MNEAAPVGPSLDGGDPALSQQLENRLTSEGRQDLLPEGYIPGEPIVGMPLNPDFNKGVEPGPHMINDGAVQEMVRAGWTEDAARQALDARAKQAAMGRNTYPLYPGSVGGELGKTHAALDEQGKDKAA